MDQSCFRPVSTAFLSGRRVIEVVGKLPRKEFPRCERYGHPYGLFQHCWLGPAALRLRLRRYANCTVNNTAGDTVDVADLATPEWIREIPVGDAPSRPGCLTRSNSCLCERRGYPGRLRHRH